MYHINFEQSLLPGCVGVGAVVVTTGAAAGAMAAAAEGGRTPGIGGTTAATAGAGKRRCDRIVGFGSC